MTSKWVVQAHWRVGEQERSYEPVWCESLQEARQARAAMIETLRHFVGLDVTIAETSGEALPADPTTAPRSSVTVHAAGKDGEPLCGALVDVGNSVIDMELFGSEVDPEALCAMCRSRP